MCTNRKNVLINSFLSDLWCISGHPEPAAARAPSAAQRHRRLPNHPGNGADIGGGGQVRLSNTARKGILGRGLRRHGLPTQRLDGGRGRLPQASGHPKPFFLPKQQNRNKALGKN